MVHHTLPMQPSHHRYHVVDIHCMGNVWAMYGHLQDFWTSFCLTNKTRTFWNLESEISKLFVSCTSHDLTSLSVTSRSEMVCWNFNISTAWSSIASLISSRCRVNSSICFDFSDPDDSSSLIFWLIEFMSFVFSRIKPERWIRSRGKSLVWNLYNGKSEISYALGRNRFENWEISYAKCSSDLPSNKMMIRLRWMFQIRLGLSEAKCSFVIMGNICGIHRHETLMTHDSSPFYMSNILDFRLNGR